MVSVALVVILMLYYCIITVDHLFFWLLGLWKATSIFLFPGWSFHGSKPFLERARLSRGLLISLERLQTTYARVPDESSKEDVSRVPSKIQNCSLGEGFQIESFQQFQGKVQSKGFQQNTSK